MSSFFAGMRGLSLNALFSPGASPEGRRPRLPGLVPGGRDPGDRAGGGDAAPPKATFGLAAVLFLLGLIASPGVSFGAGTPGNSVIPLDSELPASITITPVTERWDGRGFMPLIVRAENRGERALAWNLSFTSGIGFGGDSLTHQVALRVEGGDRIEAVVYVPGTGALGSGQRATVNIRAEGPGADRARSYMLHGNNDSVVNTAVIPSLEAALFTATNGAPGERTEITPVEPARWPADWRVWAPFQRVVFTEEAFSALDSARQGALNDWVSMGGVLDLYPAESRANDQSESRGLGVVRRRARSLADEATDSKLAPMLPSSRIVDLYSARRPEVSVERRASLAPKRGTLGVALFLLGFGVVVGPLNLFVFAPSGRRHRLFFTVPGISLAASALLAGFIVVQDGFGGEGAVIGTVCLLPDSNQAVVTQTQIARTGVLAGSGFELADDVVLEHTSSRSGDWPNRSGERANHYQRSQGRVAGDWFASRRVQEHLLRRLAPTRARVELVGGGEGAAAPVVQSSVGAVLKDFLYVDDKGSAWGAEELAPGQKVTLVRRQVFPKSGRAHWGFFSARGGAAEGLTPISTLDSIRWDEPEFLFVGPVVGARKP